MKRTVLVIAASVAGALLLAGCNETPESAKPPAAPPVAPSLSDAEKARIDALPNDELVALVLTASGPQFDYADQRLADIIKNTTDEKLIELVTAQKLPFGQSMNQANQLKFRLRSKSS